MASKSSPAPTRCVGDNLGGMFSETSGTITLDTAKMPEKPNGAVLRLAPEVPMTATSVVVTFVGGRSAVLVKSPTKWDAQNPEDFRLGAGGEAIERVVVKYEGAPALPQGDSPRLLVGLVICCDNPKSPQTDACS